MIKNIIFDFGDIFINLDKLAVDKNLKEIGLETFPEKMLLHCYDLETGKLTKDEFVEIFVNEYYDKLKGENFDEKCIEFIKIWNSILLDFPNYRLKFLIDLKKSKKYRLFLLSNTNEIHISWVKKSWGIDLYNEFKNCFEQFYLSHEINLRKPNTDIYEFVLSNNQLIADETLFIDDTKENTDSASKLGIHVWNLNPNSDDIIQLLTKNILN